jgi:glycosyltransferase involved in cell wall biosynthesis
MNKPPISIVMPVYNGEEFLNQAVESILSQSFTDFEFVIVNDGSVDRTSKILHSYKDPRIILIEGEKKGFSASLNEGISKSSGKYIARMDSDDISVINRLQLQFEFMEEHKEVGILGGQIILIDENGFDVGKKINPTSFENIRRVIEIKCPVFHPTYYVRSAVYECLQGYRDFTVAEDYDFLFRALEKGFVINNLSEIVLKYRMRKKSMSKSNLQQTLFVTSCIKKMHKLRLKGKDSDNKIFARIYDRKKQTSAWFLFVIGMKEYLDKIGRTKPLIRPLTVILKTAASLFHYQVLWLVLEGFIVKRIEQAHRKPANDI